MKLVIAVVQGEDAQRTSEALTASGFGSTRITSSGGFLQQGNVTFLIGIEDTRVAGIATTYSFTATRHAGFATADLAFLRYTGARTPPIVR